MDADAPKPVSPPPLSIGGFIGASLSAPGLALIICMLGAVATALFSPGIADAMGSAVLGVILFFFVVTIWGAVPSLVFGGLVLALMHRMPWRRRPAAVEFMAGGVVAAGLYILAGLGVARLSPGSAMFFAPWATPELMGPRIADAWWLVVSMLLAGAGAGLFYAVCVKRG